MDELQTQLSYYAGGTTVELTVQRLVDGQYQEQTISVTLDTEATISPAAQTAAPSSNGV